jgi:hypothetical protein
MSQPRFHEGQEAEIIYTGSLVKIIRVIHSGMNWGWLSYEVELPSNR